MELAVPGKGRAGAYAVWFVAGALGVRTAVDRVPGGIGAVGGFEDVDLPDGGPVRVDVTIG